MASLYVEQLQGGRYFLHEHPERATSWQESAMEELKRVPGVILARADQCQYGAEVRYGTKYGQPVKNPRASSRIPRSWQKHCPRGAVAGQRRELARVPKVDIMYSVPDALDVKQRFILAISVAPC